MMTPSLIHGLPLGPGDRKNRTMEPDLQGRRRPRAKHQALKDANLFTTAKGTTYREDKIMDSNSSQDRSSDSTGRSQ
ncbi:hypothetical protein NDU88_000466 [Pleurodeles waltl]|uniref:Uncharacterized protein n=1 Tax=Pleurodeles waltl TaxID=8319 RepID=A0AAV7S744_PLEWA|nr:hypothetical protein NDU88_000466 [Pleurodeles waltl]